MKKIILSLFAGLECVLLYSTCYSQKNKPFCSILLCVEIEEAEKGN